MKRTITLPLAATLIVAASVILAAAAYPMVSGQEELERWMQVYISRVNVLYFVVTLGAPWMAYTETAKLLKRWPRWIAIAISAAAAAVALTLAYQIMSRQNPLGLF